MKTQTTLTLIGAAAAVALSASAASAQVYGDRYERHYGYGDRGVAMSIDQRISRLDRRIERGVMRGDLTRREAYALRAEFRRIAHREDVYSRDGLNRWEVADLDRRMDELEARIRYDRHDNEYGYGYGRDYRR